MIKVILIDDERPALRELEYFLKKFQSIEISGLYTDPITAIKAVEEIKPDAVFLDINMPQMIGTDIASMILDSYHDTNIVFVTAYNNYAVEAFEVHALDYILKPLSEERIEKTVSKLEKKHFTSLYASKTLKIKCLGGFQMWFEGCEPIKWRTEKTCELFAYLLHMRGRRVRRDDIIDKLWPEIDPERAAHQVHNTVYYLRKAIRDYGIEESHISISGTYCLKVKNVSLDVDAFRSCISEGRKNKDYNVLMKCIEEFAGTYYDGCGWSWAEPEREQLNREYLFAVSEMSKSKIDEGDFDGAERLLLKAFLSYPYEEILTELLLDLYQNNFSDVKAVQHYKKYSDILKKDLGIEPGDKIKKKLKML